MGVSSENFGDIDAIGVVIIGRNEGERLTASLKSVAGRAGRIVYVDSGSTDESCENAAAHGADIVKLNDDTPFTAARARNAGFSRLKASGEFEFVQFVDGDCELAPSWLDKAAAFLRANPNVGVVCGRRRERFPEKSLFNRLVDREWATPIGETLACGGDAMMRMRAFHAVHGFRGEVIAGEEPELCARLRDAGWKIHRIDADMTLHDIDMTRLGQWLKRARRAGHAYGELSYLRRKDAQNIWAQKKWRALLWTGFLALALFYGLFVTLWAFAALLVLPAQVAHIALRDRPATSDSWAYAILLVLQKPWEAAGVLQYWLRRAGSARRTLIEYKN